MGFFLDRTDQKKGVNQTKPTEMWVLNISRSPKYGQWSYQIERNMGIVQTKIWVSNRPNIQKYGYCPDRTEQNMVFSRLNLQQTEKRTLTKPKNGY